MQNAIDLSRLRVVLTRRADSVASRLAWCAVAALFAHRQRETAQVI